MTKLVEELVGTGRCLSLLSLSIHSCQLSASMTSELSDSGHHLRKLLRGKEEKTFASILETWTGSEERTSPFQQGVVTLAHPTSQHHRFSL